MDYENMFSNPDAFLKGIDLSRSDFDSLADTAGASIEQMQIAVRALNEWIRKQLPEFTNLISLLDSDNDIAGELTKLQKQVTDKYLQFLDEQIEYEKSLSEQERKKREKQKELRDTYRKSIETINDAVRRSKQELEDLDELIATALTDEEREKYKKQRQSVAKEYQEVSRAQNYQELGKAIFGNNFGEQKTPNGDPTSAAIVDVGKTIVTAIKNLGNILSKKLDEGVQQALGSYQKYLGPISTRLSADSNKFDEMISNMTSVIGLSPYASQQKYLENLSALVDKGINYNVEERAYLATISDRIATTFDSLDENLTRLIRLQQSDVTRSRLGSEAQLTEFLNQNFYDTSYLNQLYDTVNNNLIEATSMMDLSQSTSYTYAAQKWLGSLYSVGLSDETIGRLSKGLGYLGSGDISQLGGDTALLNLFALSASRSGLSLADMLVGGITSSDIDVLMTSMVEYLSEIAKNTDNKVLKSEWSDIFGIAVSDLRAAANLSAEDISTIIGSDLSSIDAVSAENYLINSMTKLTNRTSWYDEINNFIDNIFFGLGTEIVKQAPTYIMYMLPQYAERIFGSDTATAKIIETLAKGAKAVSILNAVENYIGNVTSVLPINLDAGEVISTGEYTDPNTGNIYYNDEKGTFWNQDAGKIMYGIWKTEQGNGAAGLASNIPSDPSEGLVSYLTMTKYDKAQAILNSWGSKSNTGRGSNYLSGLINMDLGYSSISGTNYNSALSRSTTYATAAIETSAAALETFATVEQQVAETKQDIVSQSEELTDNIDKLYDILFVHQSTPIRVKIADAEEDFVMTLSDLLTERNSILADDIGDYIESSNQNVDNLITQLNIVRGM